MIEATVNSFLSRHLLLRKRVSLILLSLLIGCSCKSGYMQDFDVVSPIDKELNCKQLDIAINEAQYLLNISENRYNHPHAYAAYPVCMPYTQLDALKSKFSLQDRVAYLKALHKIKKCEEVK